MKGLGETYQMKKQLSFRKRVLAVVAKIPKGNVLTYAEVARRVDSPRAARAVGAVLKGNFNPAIPCHRVIRSDGRLGGYNRGAAQKEKLIERERRECRERAVP